MNKEFELLSQKDIEAEEMMNNMDKAGMKGMSMYSREEMNQMANKELAESSEDEDDNDNDNEIDL